MKEIINIKVSSSDEVSKLVMELIFEITILLEKERINYLLEMKSWSNEKQKDVIFEESSYAEFLKTDEKKYIWIILKK